MPGNLSSFSNPGGTPVATSADEFYQRQALAAKAASQQDAALAAMLSEGAANRAHQLTLAGSYADKSRDMRDVQQAGFAHDTGMEGLRGTNALALGKQGNEGALQRTQISVQPQMDRNALDREKYANEWNAGAPERNTTRAIFEEQGDLIKQQRLNAGASVDDRLSFLSGLRDPNFLIQKDRSKTDSAKLAAEAEQAKRADTIAIITPLLESGTAEGINEANKYLASIGMAPDATDEILMSILRNIGPTVGSALGRFTVGAK
jgi:hypothetical protein